MKIAVILPTRSRPELLRTVLGAFRHLESGQHDVRYFIRVDDDEMRYYWDCIEADTERVVFLFGDAPLTPAMKVMDIIECQSFTDFDPDIHVLMSDDIFPMTMNWDVVIGAAIHQGIGAFCWQEWNDQLNQTYIILDRHYVERMPVYLPTWFPFWFSDTWRNEVHTMVFKRSIPIISDLKLGGKRGKTSSMLDLEFWFDFFAYTREDRIDEAELMAKNHGIPFNRKNIPFNLFYEWDMKQKKRLDVYKDKLQGTVSPRYAEAKLRAERHLKLLVDKSSKIMVSV